MAVSLSWSVLNCKTTEMHVMLLLLTKRMSQLEKKTCQVSEIFSSWPQNCTDEISQDQVYYELLRMLYIATGSKFVQQIYERTRWPFNKPNSSSTLCMPLIYRYIKTESASTKVAVTYNISSFKIRGGVIISTDWTSTLPSHYLNQCCLIFNRTLWNKLQ